MEVLPPLTLPFLSSPSSPTRIIGAFRSAPSSPPRISEPPTDDIDGDFAFNVTADVSDSFFFAEELFDGGKIKAVQPLPPPQSPPRAAEEKGRGRAKGMDVAMSKSCRRGARSMSPVRSGKDLWRVELENAAVGEEVLPPERVASSRGFKKWSLKDLLFRSASEGHAADKHPPRYGAAEVHSRRVDAPSRKNTSPHERHYIWKKAAAEDMKRKTFLPYRHGILGRFSFSALVHAPARHRG